MSDMKVLLLNEQTRNTDLKVQLKASRARVAELEATIDRADEHTEMLMQRIAQLERKQCDCGAKS